MSSSNSNAPIPQTFQLDTKPIETDNIFHSINTNRNEYDEQMTAREHRLNDRKEFIEKLIKENFPVKFVVFHAVALSILALIAVTFQSLMIVYKYSFYYIGSGYW